MKEFSFLVGNCPGALVDIAEALGAEHINIEGIAGLTVLEEGVVGLVTDDHGKARRVLRDKGVDFEEREALVIDLPNHPGELAAILTRLSAEGINVLSVYAAVGKHQAIFTVDEVDRAKGIFHLT
ncbi:MAG: hypothetical protein PHV11_00565 [Candidatus Bipolaricaulis sp.]|nr:hypothetical protein [Candidatus Bipolaricaulis sp.]MDD5219047.1 hypothetical protein [Candidatus Bipolaricaulis sp.]MDD5646474.1 hypothetical protein [Candidatus Bipolaricaulis sp.]